MVEVIEAIVASKIEISSASTITLISFSVPDFLTNKRPSPESFFSDYEIIFITDGSLRGFFSTE